jgi:lipid A 3-O-deacylase
MTGSITQVCNILATAGVAALLACTPAKAEDSATRPMLNLQIGDWQGYQNFTLGVDTRPFWSHSGRSRDELISEVSVGLAQYDGRAVPERGSLWHAGAQGFFRWYTASRSYVELGVGPTFFSRTIIGDRELSTHFQFADSVGFAHLLSENVVLGIRFTHFSNAGIKRPNAGTSFVQLVASHSL